MAHVVEYKASEMPFISLGLKRSPKWAALSRRHRRHQPDCQLCGSLVFCTTHHILPFHLFPEHELDPDNLITLCEGQTINCHYFLGHMLDWKSYNPHLLEDIHRYRPMIKRRRKQG